MQSLDDKLKEILVIYEDDESATCYCGEGYPRSMLLKEVPETIAQIKQAFADEGYRWLPREKSIDELVKMGLVEKCLTGQEWYDRYKKLSDENYDTEVPRKPNGGYDYKAFGESLAKKAAGIK